MPTDNIVRLPRARRDAVRDVLLSLDTASLEPEEVVERVQAAVPGATIPEIIAELRHVADVHMHEALALRNHHTGGAA